MFIILKKTIPQKRRYNIFNYRVEELISELEQCREDERVCQSQILQSISAMLTVLGLFYGAYFFSEKNGDNTNFYLKIIFHASNIAFCAVFSFIITLGIEKNLRYYYIKDIEERLSFLIKSSPDDLISNKEFMHWNEFSAPIITRNPRHLKSFHSFIYWIFTSASILFPIFFCIPTLFIFFKKMTVRSKYDYLALYLLLLFMFFSFILFIISALTAKGMSEYSQKMAYQNRKSNVNQRYKSNANMIYYRKLIKYLIYPKLQDLQKPLIIVLGFVLFSFYSNNYTLNGLTNLFLSMFIFDFLAYQARYQINDIRGIQEDIQMVNLNRLPLPSKDNNLKTKDVIKISLFVAFIKFFLAIVIVFFLKKKLRKTLFISIILLLFSTLLYEFFKAQKINYTQNNKMFKLISHLTIYFVGAGYPLRLFLGINVASINCDKPLSIINNISLISSMWFYGVSSSLLVWITEIYQKGKSSADKFKKTHYKLLYTILYKNNYLSSSITSNAFLRKKGHFFEIWNFYYILSIISINWGIFSTLDNLLIIILETIVLFISLGILYKYNSTYIYTNILLQLVLIIIVFITYKNQNFTGYMTILQLIYNITYYVLKYKPPKFSFKFIIKLFLMFERKIISDEIYNKYF